MSPRRWLALTAVMIGILPLLLHAVFGFYHNRDVTSGIQSLFTSFHGDIRVFRPGMLHEPPVPPLRRRLDVTWSGDLENPALVEASGLAASNRDADLYFAVNDSGNEPRLFLLDRTGADLGSWPFSYPKHHDIEDLSAFTFEDRPYLLVADTGDNFFWRRTLTVFVAAQPLAAELSPDSEIEIAWSIRFTLPDGYRDIEAVAVDETSESVLLVSKRRVPAEVYQIPLQPTNEVVEAQHIADLVLPQPTERDFREDPEYGFGRSMPTALDIAGNYLMVQTYSDAFLYEKEPGERWQAALGRVPVRIPLPYIWGLESGSFSAGGDAWVVTGEREDQVNRTGVFEVDLGRL